MKTKLEKHTVCSDCWSVGIQFNDCQCTYRRDYDVIELEFETCGCCGNLVSDGTPADTEFNRVQLGLNKNKSIYDE